MPRMFIFGLGYTASRLADALRLHGWEIVATGRDGDLAFDDHGTVRAALADASHVLSSVPPQGDGADPVLRAYGEAMGGKWLGYLSSTGVYGDTGGAWVDETAPVGSGRRAARAECDAAWIRLGARSFRLPGIYGPGRSALDRVRQGTAHRIAAPGQVFSRVHVDDIVAGVVAALGLQHPPPSGEVAACKADGGGLAARLPPSDPRYARASSPVGGGFFEAPPGAYNLADDEPCHQNLVIEDACRLLGVAPPPVLPLDQAGLSPTARGFYAENRRVANGKARRLLGWQPRYPTYREGLRAIADCEP